MPWHEEEMKSDDQAYCQEEGDMGSYVNEKLACAERLQQKLDARCSLDFEE